VIRARIRKRLPRFELDIDLEADGCTSVLWGESGSGKTTILECVAGLVRPDSGEIRLEDRLVFSSEKGIDLPPRSRGVGYVFQDYELFPHLTAEENVALAMPRSERHRARDYLERFGIGGLARRKPALLSGGERQRLALARALAVEPRLLLLDESFSALDRSTRQEMYAEFLSLRESLGMSVILVTHNRSEAELLGHRIFELREGSLAEEAR